jgi:hypothetical protein
VGADVTVPSAGWRSVYRALGVALPYADDPAGPGEANPTMSKSERLHDAGEQCGERAADVYREAFRRLAVARMEDAGAQLHDVFTAPTETELEAAPEQTIREARAALDEARATLDEIEAAHPAAERER